MLLLGNVSCLGLVCFAESAKSLFSFVIACGCILDRHYQCHQWTNERTVVVAAFFSSSFFVVHSFSFHLMLLLLLSVCFVGVDKLIMHYYFSVVWLLLPSRTFEFQFRKDLRATNMIAQCMSYFGNTCHSRCWAFEKIYNGKIFQQ